MARRLLPLALALSLTSGLLVSPPAHAESPANALTLLSGQDLAAWELITLPDTPADLATVCQLKPDGVLAVTGKPVSYLATKASYENYRLQAEWRWPATAPENSNSGFLLHVSSGPANGTAWPVCFQVQLKHTRAGDILPMAGATFAEKLSSAPGAKTPQRERFAADSEVPRGEWNTCDIVCRDGLIEVTINGVLQNRVTHCTPAAGKIGIQLEGAPFELRKLRLLQLP